MVIFIETDQPDKLKPGYGKISEKSCKLNKNSDKMGTKETSVLKNLYLFRKLFDFFSLSPEEKEIFRTVISMENIRRVLILSLFAIPTSILYLIIFRLKASGTGGIEDQWRTAISASHTVLLISFIVIGILIYFFSYKHRENNRIARICVKMAVVLLLFGGAIITAADQLVISSITAFFSTTLVVGLLLLIPPVHSFFYFISSYCVFYYAISLTQSNHDVLVSNQINGITATALGLCLSFILWKGYLIRIKQTRLIEKQNRELQTAFDMVNSQKNDVEQLSQIGRDITSSLSIENIIQTIYKNVNTLMDASVFTIGLFNQKEGILEFPSAIEKNRILSPFSVPVSDEKHLAAWCFNHQEEVIINDCGMYYGKFKGQLTTSTSMEPPKSVLYLPLWYKDKTIGVISAQSFNKEAYSDYHVNMLRNLAAYSAIALENADAYRQLATLLEELKSTQDKLVTQSKLAALGALTAGIAHEIKNPLNFINNFSALNAELVEELKQKMAEEKQKMDSGKIADIEEIMTMITDNAAKVQEHSRRADSIVRSMLQHSRGGSGELQPADINALLEEALNLTYHGMRAQDAGFNIKIEKSFDESIGKMNVVPQELSRVLLNIINNGFYEAYRKKLTAGSGFSPVLSVHTGKQNDMVIITIRDNGDGVPEVVKPKLFTPFFTTKPVGQGTGLGLSIAYDIIVHQHHGQISFETEEGQYTEFTILLPYGNS
jgi:signal transduction histidine kinase